MRSAINQAPFTLASPPDAPLSQLPTYTHINLYISIISLPYPCCCPRSAPASRRCWSRSTPGGSGSSASPPTHKAHTHTEHTLSATHKAKHRAQHRHTQTHTTNAPFPPRNTRVETRQSVIQPKAAKSLNSSHAYTHVDPSSYRCQSFSQWQQGGSTALMPHTSSCVLPPWWCACWPSSTHSGPASRTPGHTHQPHMHHEHTSSIYKPIQLCKKRNKSHRRKGPISC